MKEAFNMVRGFHRAFDFTAPDAPTLNTPEVQAFHVRLIDEELQEYEEALKAGNIEEIADALCDLAYVVIGSAVSHGLTRFHEMFAEVQRSNMSKLGEDGRPIKREDGKVVKGPRFFKPNLAQFLK